MSIPTSGGYPAGEYATGNPSASMPPVKRVDFGWITESWQLFMAHTGIWIVATLAMIGPFLLFAIGIYAYMIVTMLPSIQAASHPAVPGTMSPSTPAIFRPGNMRGVLTVELSAILVFSLYSAFLFGGMFRMAVRQVRGLAPTYRDILGGGPLFGRMLGAMFLLYFVSYALQAIGLGPGYVLLFRHAPTVATVLTFAVGGAAYLFAALVLPGLLLPAFALMADGVRLFPALRRSVQAMKAHWLPATGFVFVMGLLVYASEIPCGLGLLATVPMAFLVTALAYRDLAGMPGVLPLPAPFHPTAAPGVWPPAPSMTMEQENNR